MLEVIDEMNDELPQLSFEALVTAFCLTHCL